MIHISTRRASLILILLALPLVPVWLHHPSGRWQDTCAEPSAFLAYSEDLAVGTLENKGKASAQDEFIFSVAGETRLFADGNAAVFQYSIARSFSTVPLLLDPQQFITRDFDSDSRTVEWFEFEGVRVPVFFEFLPGFGNALTISAYIYIYGNRVTRHPFLEQLLSAPRQMFGRSRPISLVLIHGKTSLKASDEIRKNMGNWLVETLMNYRRICGH
jgi:hypothetical protein